jgi:hypothetical protein
MGWCDAEVRRRELLRLGCWAFATAKDVDPEILLPGIAARPYGYY